MYWTFQELKTIALILESRRDAFGMLLPIEESILGKIRTDQPEIDLVIIQQQKQ